MAAAPASLHGGGGLSSGPESLPFPAGICRGNRTLPPPRRRRAHQWHRVRCPPIRGHMVGGVPTPSPAPPVVPAAGFAGGGRRHHHRGGSSAARGRVRASLEPPRGAVGGRRLCLLRARYPRGCGLLGAHRNAKPPAGGAVGARLGPAAGPSACTA